MPRNSGEDITRASHAGGVGGGHLASRVHQPAVSDGRKHCWERKFMSQHSSLEVAIGNGHRATRAERHVAESTAVLRQRKLGFSASIQVVEHRLGKAALRQAS